MSTFYEKLSMKLQGSEGAPAANPASPASKSVTYNATGERTSPQKDPAPAVAAAPEAAPDGTDPIDVDLFQSDARMVIFMQVAGIPPDAFDIVINEESNTMIIEAAQKRPPLPRALGAKEGDAPEKGIYSKQEVKWRSLYRKIYLPAPFDGGEVTATLDKGVLIISLPAKAPGAGKKLVVREAEHDEQKK